MSVTPHRNNIYRIRHKQLTPRKLQLMKQKRLYQNLASNLKRKLKDTKSSFPTFNKHKKKTTQLLNKYIKHLDNLSSLAKTFITAQLKYTSSKMGRKWTNEEKALCLAIFKYSPKCYKFLQSIFILPSIRTLHRTLAQVNINTGINESLFDQLSKISNNVEFSQRYCVLLFDEIYLQPHLSINTKLNRVEGLENLGNETTKYIADHALVFMLRGINSSWKQPLCFYLVHSTVRTHYLKTLIETVIIAVHERTKFKILLSVCDQGSTNMSAIKLLCKESGCDDIHNYYYMIREYKILHIFDVPHLIKCVRNHFLQKDIHFGDKIATWSDLVKLHTLDGSDYDAQICNKITEKHLFPTNKQKMRVKYATQIFSRTVYAALIFAKNCNAIDEKGTAEFIYFMDQLFDSLNSIKNGTKPLQKAITDVSPHFNFWTKAENFLRSLKFNKEDKYVTSPPSIKNLIITIYNIQNLWKILKDLDFKYLLTRTLNQDPLENFFGVIRSLCGQNFKSTCEQFVSAFKTCLINNLMLNSKSSNCENDGAYFLTSFLNSSTVYNISQQSLMLENQQCKEEISSSILNMESYSSSYIAYFVIKHFINIEHCLTCQSVYLTTECTDSHRIISINNNANFYPSKKFIEIISKLKNEAAENFIRYINSRDIFDTVNHTLTHVSQCPEHECNSNLKLSIMFITFKHICVLINKKLNLKDKRPNVLIDEYIFIYGRTFRSL